MANTRDTEVKKHIHSTNCDKEQPPMEAGSMREPLFVRMMKMGAHVLSTTRRGILWTYALFLAKPTQADPPKPRLCEGEPTYFHLQSPEGNLYRLSVVSPVTAAQKFLVGNYLLDRYEFPDLAEVYKTQQEAGEKLSGLIYERCGWKDVKLPPDEIKFDPAFFATPYREDRYVKCHVVEWAAKSKKRGNETTEGNTCVQNVERSGKMEAKLRALQTQDLDLKILCNQERWEVELLREKFIILTTYIEVVCIVGSVYTLWKAYQLRVAASPAIPENNANEERLSAIGIEDEDIPYEYKCGITLAIMNDPVITSSGKIYDRHAIVQWIRTRALAGQEPRDPFTWEPISQHLIPAESRRLQIEAYVREQEALYKAQRSKGVAFFSTIKTRGHQKRSTVGTKKVPQPFSRIT